MTDYFLLANGVWDRSLVGFWIYMYLCHDSSNISMIIYGCYLVSHAHLFKMLSFLHTRCSSGKRVSWLVFGLIHAQQKRGTCNIYMFVPYSTTHNKPNPSHLSTGKDVIIFRVENGVAK